ncbi:hypothetical protein STENM327S_05314 [Streptomyces tendae]
MQDALVPRGPAPGLRGPGVAVPLLLRLSTQDVLTQLLALMRPSSRPTLTPIGVTLGDFARVFLTTLPPSHFSRKR